MKKNHNKLKAVKKQLMFSGVSFLALLVCLAIISFVAYSAARLANAASRTNSSVRCTTNYQPVCGTDNKTYSNSCQAGLKGITVAYEGKCGSKKVCQAGQSLLTRVSDCSVDWAYNGSGDTACCANPSDCVRNGVCYETEKPAFFGGGGHDQKVFCDRNNGWSDYDSSQGGRDPTCLDNYPYASDQCERDGVGKSTLSGESGVGEYDEHGLPYQCCGDDKNEYNVTNFCSGYSGPAKCCNNKNDKISAEGKCVASCPSSNKVSNFFQNMWNRIRKK